MHDILESIKAYLYDRSSSPLFGAFVLSWSAWNYRVIASVLSSDPLSAKFAVIDKVFGSIDFGIAGNHFWLSGRLVNGFLIPLIATLFYIYVYPRLAKPVFEYSLNRQKELREIKQVAENDRLLTVEESRELHKKLALLQVAFDKELEDSQREVANLRKVVAEYEASAKSQDDKKDIVRSSQEKLSKNEISILREFSGRGDEEYLNDLLIHKIVGGQIDVVRVHLDELVTKGYLRYAGTNDRGVKLYSLQPAGRRYLVDNDLVKDQRSETGDPNSG